MKKLLSIALSVILLLGSVTIGACAADNDIKVTVANDLHFSASSLVPFTKDTSEDAYAHVPSSGQMLVESNAIIKAFLAQEAKGDSDVVLLPGDLVNAGAAAEHIAFAALLADFEADTGKPVYVVPGNHDLFKSSLDEFKLYYNQFGYSEAIAADTLSGSYVVDLNSEYRLLAIDSTIPGDSYAGIDAERVAWIEAQCKAAAADGKHVIAMMHHNLLEHFIFSSSIHKTALVDQDTGLAEVLASNGVKVIFTAHTHDQDIATYTASNGNVIYDAVTNSLNAYPVQYRTVTFGDEIRFEEKRVEKIDTSLLPAGLSDEAVALADSDFTQYSKICMWKGMREGFESYLSPSYLKKLLELDEEENADMAAVFDKVSTKLCEALKMPMYKVDETESGKSIESLAASYGKSIPASDYDDMIDLVITIYQAHCVGDEYYPAYTNEIIILKNALISVLGYTLSDVTAEEYTAVLTYVCQLLDAEVPDGILSFAGSALQRVEGIELIVSTVVMPLMTQFTVDSSPADNELTIAGYGKEENKVKSFFDLIKEFFKKFIDFFKSLFSMFK